LGIAEAIFRYFKKTRHFDHVSFIQGAFMRGMASIYCASALLCGLVLCGQTFAGSAKASAANPSAPAFSSGGYLNVAAYSEQVDIGSNASVTSDVVLGGSTAASPGQYRSGVGLTSQQIAVQNGFKVSPLTGKMVPSYTYSGPVAQILGPGQFALNKGQLSQPDDHVSITSTTGAYSGSASVSNQTNPLINLNFPKYAINAEATVDDSGDVLPGDASALAGDPVNIPAGTYTYDPSLDSSVQLTKDEEGSARVYAVDGATFTSDSVDNFVADGESVDHTLWTLTQYGSAGGAGGISGYDFYLNPAALSEITFPSSYLATLGSYSDATSEALLIDQAVDDDIFSLTGGTSDLADFDPFPSGTTYTPSVDGEEYADGADAVIAAPEPGIIFLPAILAILGAQELRRRTH
jgi:hypothetical protein